MNYLKNGRLQSLKPTESSASNYVEKNVCMDMNLSDDDTPYSIKKIE